MRKSIIGRLYLLHSEIHISKNFCRLSILFSSSLRGNIKNIILQIKKVNFFTYGENNILKRYVRKYKNINLININTKLNIQKKTRYLNSNRFEKILQVTNFKKLNLSEHTIRLMKLKIQRFNLKKNIIICDFGVGLFENNFLNSINRIKDKYLNVQTNSLNYGYNSVKKYTEAHYVSLDEREWRLALQDQEDSLLLKLKKLKNYHYKSLTRGKNGSIFIDEKNKLIKSPVFFNKTIDTTGCGDAYFILSSILLINKCPLGLIPFLSNIYAGIHSQSLGNEKVITKNEYLKVIKSILNI